MGEVEATNELVECRDVWTRYTRGGKRMHTSPVLGLYFKFLFKKKSIGAYTVVLKAQKLPKNYGYFFESYVLCIVQSNRVFETFNEVLSWESKFVFISEVSENTTVCIHQRNAVQ